jgi:hypothetical protein
MYISLIPFDISVIELLISLIELMISVIQLQICQKEFVIMYISEIRELVICTYQKLAIK